MTKRAYNPTDGPVVIDREGRILAGGEWGAVTDNPAVTDAVNAGRLLLEEPSKTTRQAQPADKPKE